MKNIICYYQGYLYFYEFINNERRVFTPFKMQFSRSFPKPSFAFFSQQLFFLPLLEVDSIFHKHIPPYLMKTQFSAIY